MKSDGFGIEHRPDCREPAWSSVRADPGSAVQRCRRCGVTWRPSDPTTPARPRVGYTPRKRNQS